MNKKISQELENLINVQRINKKHIFNINFDEYISDINNHKVFFEKTDIMADEYVDFMKNSSYFTPSKKPICSAQYILYLNYKINNKEYYYDLMYEEESDDYPVIYYSEYTLLKDYENKDIKVFLYKENEIIKHPIIYCFHTGVKLGAFKKILDLITLDSSHKEELLIKSFNFLNNGKFDYLIFSKNNYDNYLSKCKDDDKKEFINLIVEKLKNYSGDFINKKDIPSNIFFNLITL